MKLAIVDDSILFRKSIRRLLDSIDDLEIVAEAASVAEAVKMLQEEKPDAVLLDIELPDGNGFDVVDQVFSAKYRPHTIVLTNYPTAAYRELARQRKIRHFYDKTTEFITALEILRDWAIGRPMI